MPTPRKKAAPANKVDETVVNQEHPISSEKERESTDTPVEAPEVAKSAPANEVDVTVINQESLGAGEVVDRQEPIIVEDNTGTKFNVAKSYPEIVTEDKEDEARKNELRQNEAVLNAKNIEDPEGTEKPEHKHIDLYFLESGLTVNGRVWKVGQTLTLEDNEDTRAQHEDIDGNVWYELSADEQKKRYGKVFFEKR